MIDRKEKKRMTTNDEEKAEKIENRICIDEMTSFFIKYPDLIFMMHSCTGK